MEKKEEKLDEGIIEWPLFQYDYLSEEGVKAVGDVPVKGSSTKLATYLSKDLQSVLNVSRSPERQTWIDWKSSERLNPDPIADCRTVC
ncbi:hypothetical protein RB195_002644 [Necator americanus]|uniref:Uncharacterized protein n=1 Tax=Necator americanus TaxID=51031 RepID=A0ABR1DK12_NECAM